MATVKALRQSPQVSINKDWSLIATAAIHQTDGMPCTIGLFNGQLKDPRTLDVNDPDARGRVIQAFAERAQVEAETVERALMELVTEIEGLLQEADDDTGRKSQSTRLIELAEESNAVFFRDQLGDPHCATEGDGRVALRVRSRAFRQWLRRLMWLADEKSPGGQAIEDALGHLEGKAIFDGEEIPLEVRAAWHQGVLWYDLGEQAVRVTEAGWDIVAEPPVLFRRFKANGRQALPLRGGNAADLLSFTRVTGDQDRCLLMAQVIVAFIPGFPQAALVLSGDHGAAKSTLQRLIKALVDPSPVATFAPPDTLKEFVQQVSHHWVAFYDNLASLPQWLSDGLCRVVTGDGFSKRELYSDDDDILYAFRRVVGLNGINLVVEKPDLLDRSVLINLDRVPDSERREDKEFLAAFDAAKPAILGSIFDIISKAMAIYPILELQSLPRMADFARWGEAVTQAMGGNPGEFLKAYAGNVERQNQTAIDASPVAQALVHMMSGTDRWEGAPTELLDTLTQVANDLKLNTAAKSWPKDSRWVWRRIKEVRPNLIAIGILTKDKRSEKARKIVITRTFPENDVIDVTVVSAKQNQSLTNDNTEKNDVMGVVIRPRDDDTHDDNDNTEKNDVSHKPLKDMAADDSDINDNKIRTCPGNDNDFSDLDVLSSVEGETEAQRAARRPY